MNEITASQIRRNEKKAIQEIQESYDQFITVGREVIGKALKETLAKMKEGRNEPL